MLSTYLPATAVVADVDDHLERGDLQTLLYTSSMGENFPRMGFQITLTRAFQAKLSVTWRYDV